VFATRLLPARRHSSFAGRRVNSARAFDRRSASGDALRERENRMTRDDLVGVYRQIGEDIVSHDGTITDGGPRASQIVYTADGYVTVVSTRADRRRPAEPAPRVDLNGLSEAERAAAAADVVAYAGRYELRDGSVFHHIEMALNPGAVGAHRRSGPDAVDRARRGRRPPPDPLAARRGDGPVLTGGAGLRCRRFAAESLKV
jgi:hypothetical protein